MAEDITKKILIDVQLKQTQLKSDVVGLNTSLDTLLTKQKALSDANKKNTTEYVDLSSQIRIAKSELRDTNKQIDNISKAVNAENNSLSQNRALLSVLTAQYVKLNQEVGKADPQTVALGKSIAALTEKLKLQEKQIGQTYRNVGNYEEAFKSAFESLGRVIPGFEKFNTAITTVVKGFGFLPNAISQATGPSAKLNQTLGFMPQKFGDASKGIENFTVKGEEAAKTTTQLAEAAPAAEEGLGAVGISAGILSGVIAIAASAVAGFVYYLSQLPSTGEKVEQVLAGIKAGFMAFGNDVAKGDFSTLGDDMQTAYEGAVKLTEGLQELNRQMDVQEIDVAQYDRLIAHNMLLLRNKKTTYEQAVQIDKDTKKLDEDRVQEKLKNARKEYNIAVESSVNGKKISDKEKARIKQSIYEYGLEAAQALEFGNEQLGIAADQINKGSSDSIKKAALKIIQAQAEQDLQDQKSQNRLDVIEQRFGKLKNQSDQELIDAKKAYAQLVSERIASIARTVSITQDSFGKELSETQEHYRQLIFQQEKFIQDQEKLRIKTKSQKVRNQIDKNISYAKGNKLVIANEGDTDITEKIRVQTELLNDLLVKSANDLAEVQISGLKNVEQKELQSLDLRREIQSEAYDKQLKDTSLQIQRLEEQHTNSTGKEADALKAKYDVLIKIRDDSEKKDLANLKNYQQQRLDIIKSFSDREEILNDQTQILKQKDSKSKNIFGGGMGEDKNDIKAKEQLLDDQYEQAKAKRLEELGASSITEIFNAEQTDAILLNLHQQYLDGKKQLNDVYYDQIRQAELKTYEAVKNGAFTILENSIKSQAQAREVQLGKDKSRELSNTSLTSAQKLSIEDKYRKLEGQEKVKEFKADQKLSLAKAAIATAESILKASPIIPLMALAAATGAAEIGVIASQKPPAYATGGLHKSDGRGALLPGYSRHDNVNAQLRSGEAVVVSEAMQDPWARNLVSAINVRYGGRDFSTRNPGRGYAIGGIVTDGGNSNRYYAQPQEGTQNLANSIAFSLINNFPPVMVQVKDINNQQAILAKTVNRVNL